MVIEVLALAAAVAVGFGLGRVKNAAKLAAVSAVVAKIEVTATADVKAAIAAVKAKL